MIIEEPIFETLNTYTSAFLCHSDLIVQFFSFFLSFHIWTMYEIVDLIIHWSSSCEFLWNIVIDNWWSQAIFKRICIRNSLQYIYDKIAVYEKITNSSSFPEHSFSVFCYKLYVIWNTYQSTPLNRLMCRTAVVVAGDLFDGCRIFSPIMKRKYNYLGPSCIWHKVLSVCRIIRRILKTWNCVPSRWQYAAIRYWH